MFCFCLCFGFLLFSCLFVFFSFLNLSIGLYEVVTMSLYFSNAHLLLGYVHFYLEH